MASHQPMPTVEGQAPLAPDDWDEIAQRFVAGQAGDRAAYQDALSSISRRVRAYLSRRASTRLGAAAIEDVVQECLLAVHVKGATYRADAPLAPWVLAIARYKLIDHQRAHAREAHRIDAGACIADASSQPDFDSWLDVEKLLRRLPKKQRYAIERTRLWGDASMSASSDEGPSAGSLKVNVHRGLKALASYVRRRSP